MSDAQTTANRANAQKSTGPISPTGKSQAAQNARKHGLLSRHVVLPGESQADYHFLADSYITHFQPQDAVEFELVTAMVAARWRLRRPYNFQTGVLHNQLTDRSEHMDREGMTAYDDRLAYIFKQLTDSSHSLAMIVRYEGTLSRTHDRALRQLESLRSKKTPATKRTQFSAPVAPPTPNPSTT